MAKKMTPLYRTIPHIKRGQQFELMGRKATYVGGADGFHEFEVRGELDTRVFSDAQLVEYVDAGALRLLLDNTAN
jgi:hypothetical protein